MQADRLQNAPKFLEPFSVPTAALEADESIQKLANKFRKPSFSCPQIESIRQADRQRRTDTAPS